MLARVVSSVGLVLGGVLVLSLGPLVHGQDPAESARWEYKSVRIENDEKDSTRQLNELGQDGWEYLGPLANGLVAFKRPLLSLSPMLIRRIEWTNNHIFHTAFSPNSQLYLASGDTGTLRIWEVTSGRQILELPIGFGLVTPDGQHVVGHRGEKTVYIYDLTGKEVSAWDLGETIASLAVSPLGKHIVCGQGDKTIRLWELATGKEVRKFEGHTEPANGVTFSPSGKHILSASLDKTVRLWDVETGQQLRSFDEFKDVTAIDGHTLIVQAMFAGDGRVAAYVWGQEKTFVLWDAATGKKIARIDLGDDHHKDLALSRDGRWLLTGHEDRTVRLRELRTGKELHRFEMTDINVPRGLSFSPDGRYVVSGSHRSWLYLWQLQK
jgi:WD40 repeat protein